MRVIVVGGGIMGLSTALNLCKKGHKVTVFEQSSIPNPYGSSVDQHRLIRHPYGTMGGYARLVDPALKAWSQLWDDLGQSFFHQTGTLILARDDPEWIESSLSDLADMDINHTIMEPDDIKTKAPALDIDGVELAAWVQSGGVLLAQDIVRALGRQIVLRGGIIHTHTPVVDIDTQRSAVIIEDGTRIRSDRMIVAAGPWVRDICQAAVGRVKPSRQLVVYLDAPPPIAEQWSRSPMILDIHGKGGIYIVPPVGHTGLKIGDHNFSLRGHPSDDRMAHEHEVKALLAASSHRIVDINDYTVSESKICFYTAEKDEKFILEPVDKALLLTGFSGHGFKFGALMGAIAASVLAGTISTDNATQLAAGSVTEPDILHSLTSRCLD